VSSALDLWLDHAGRHPLLTPAQEITLGTAVRAWLDHAGGPDAAPPKVRRAGLRARDRLIVCNLRLVVSSVKSWFSRAEHVGLEKVDVLQIGAVGLQRAAEKFDPTRGYRFSTYATLWVTQGVRRVCATDHLIKVPAKARSDKGTNAAAADRARAISSLDETLRGTDGTGQNVIDMLAADLPDALEELAMQELTDRARAWCPDEVALLAIGLAHGHSGIEELTRKPAPGQLNAARKRLRALAAAA